MNTRLEKSVRSSDEWYTPKEILDALGKFDLDPCAPIHPLWPTAEVMYDQNIDGLSQIWKGVCGSILPIRVLLSSYSSGNWQNMATALHYYSTVAIPKCFRTSSFQKRRE